MPLALLQERLRLAMTSPATRHCEHSEAISGGLATPA
jgi:hypothetical protein